LDDPRELLQYEVTGKVAVVVVDLLEVIDIEHDEREISHVPARANDLLFEGLEQVALHMRLRETVDDGHPIDFFVVLRLDVGAREVLEDRRSDLDTITIGQPELAADLFVIYVSTVGGAVVDRPPDTAPLLEMRMTARHAVAFEHDVVLSPTAHTKRREI